jgi:hypothetical protein
MRFMARSKKAFKGASGLDLPHMAGWMEKLSKQK